MTGEAIETLILNWLDEYYPDWEEDWFEPDFDGFADLPLEIKMVPVFRLLEHNMIKGGWAQTLWNCFGNWRELIAVARAGYELFGGAEEQFTALDEFYALCIDNEADCEAAIAKEDGSSQSFGEFTRRSTTASGNQWEMALWSGTPAYWKRLKWLEQNGEHIRTTLDRLDR